MPVLTPGTGGVKLRTGKRLLSSSRQAASEGAERPVRAGGLNILAHLSYGSDAGAAAAFAAQLVSGG